ncbi:hypothetical protein BGW42_001456 [Actinomortierella wolfii]|nr:hypothetical protein BGW42_001456 [Actinomortierella wolfii]
MSNPDTNVLTKDKAKAQELIATLWRYVREQRRPSGKKSRDRRRGQQLVRPNEFSLVCAVGTSKEKGGKTRIKRRVLNLTSWKMNEYEYAKGSLPTLARGLFTYNEHDPAEDDIEDEVEEEKGGKNVGTDGDSRSRGTVDQKGVDSGQEERGEEDEEEDHDDMGSDEGEAGRLGSSEIDIDERSKNGRILIRGYNKFFNLEEVKESKMSWIREHTRGPYEVTLKENGCIIFMAGLPPGYFDEQDPWAGCLVSSKHFLGSLGDKTGKSGVVAHSDKGREWLHKTLKAKGKTVHEFGRWLWKHQITAVAELCDDSFEEHILDYPPERSGLYLHGLNHNTPDFKTWPSEDVYKAAVEWGFHPTQYVTLNSIDEVIAFTNNVRDDGEYDHRPIEGFVVRCKVPAQEGDQADNQATAAVRDHFFKIKYDEPYLMYREWREITKHLWSRRHREERKAKSKGQGAVKAETTPTELDNWVRTKYPLTKHYVAFVMRLMSEKPELFAGYNKNQGIIAIRDMFLQHWEALPQAERDTLQGPTTSAPSSAANDAQDQFDRTLIVPIATIGCGKTTASVALSQLFGWAHVSSDDFNHFSKSAGKRFIKEVVFQLGTNEVVIADRNNHQFFHREKLLEAVRETWPKTRFVALYWSHENKSAIEIIEEAGKRVENRGKNHQVMTPEYCPEYMDVIGMFVRHFEPLNPLFPPDNGFHQVIEVQFGDDARTVVQKVVDELVGRIKGANALPKPDKIDEAVRYAIEDWAPYRVTSGEAEKYHKQKMKKSEEKEKQQAAAKAKEGEARTDTESSDATAAASESASKKKAKVKEPRYFGVMVESGAVARMLQDEFQLTFPNKASSANNDVKGSNDAGKSEALPLAHAATGSSLTSNTMTKNQTAAWQECRDHVQEWVNLGRLKPEHHVTLIHASALKSADETQRQRAAQIWEDYKNEVARNKNISASTETVNLTEAMSTLSLNESQVTSTAPPALPAEMEVDTLVWTERLIAMPVRQLYRVQPNGQPGAEYETTQKILHITVALRDATVKPVESNAVLEEWKQRMKRNNGGEGKVKEGEQAIWSFTFEKPYKLHGRLRGLAY